MTRPALPLVAALSLFLAAPAAAEDVTDLDRFQLWSDCRGMRLSVADLGEDAADIDLTEEAIETAVRSRLRAARLYDADAFGHFLYVNVNVFRQVFSINVEYYKGLNDSVSGELGVATTWQIGSVGTHGWDAGYILSAVSQYMDKFIDEYLRVNEDACAR